MKIGLIADTHLHNWKTFGALTEDRISKRLLEQKDVLNQAIDLFKQNTVDFIIHLGDWAHQVGQIPVEVLNISKDILTTIECPLFFVVGNHDTVIRTSPHFLHIFTNVLDSLKKNKVNSIVEDYLVKKVFFVNYYSVIDENTVAGYDVVVLHKTPIESKYGNFVFNDGINWRILSKKNKWVLFGHIHQMQKLSDNCIVIGSPMHLSFGDSGDRGVWILDTDKNKISFYKLKYPEFLVVDSVEMVKDDYNYYKVLNLKEKVDKDNVISVIVPEYFDERIKSNNFDSIIDEWLEINQKDKKYKEVISDLLQEKVVSFKNILDGHIEKVEIINFMSIGKVEYEIPKGFTLVVGGSGDFESNGAGKTSLIGESLFWCLFGETSKGLTGDDVVRRGTKDCKVSIRLVDDKNNIVYVIERSRKNGLIIYKDGNELTSGLRQSDRQNLLENTILGFDKNLFMTACYFSQENLLLFTGLSDTERTNLVSNLLGFEVYDDLYKKVSDRIVDFENNLETLKNTKNLYETKLLLMKKDESSIDQIISMKTLDIKSLQKSISENLDKIALTKRELEVRNQKLDELKVKDKEYKIRLDELYNIEDKVQIQDDVSKEIDDLQRSNEKILSEISVIKTEMVNKLNMIDTLNDEINNLKNLKFGERCNKCGNLITKESSEIFISEKEKKKSELSNDIASMKMKILDLEKIIETNRSKEYEYRLKRDKIKSDFLKTKTEINKVISEQNRLKEEIDKITSEIVNLKSSISVLEKLITEHQNSIKKRESEIDAEMAKKASLSNSIKEVQEILSGFVSNISDLESKIEILNFWKDSFSSKGIKSLLLDRFCNIINSLINEYLSIVSSGEMYVVLSPVKLTKGGEERNKIGFDIILGNESVKYESLSGGEKRRVDISLIFGVNNFVKRYYNITSGLLKLMILDEVFSFLDKSGEESVAELLNSEGKDKSIFVIDHALNLSSYANRIWKVVKVDGISWLSVENI